MPRASELRESRARFTKHRKKLKPVDKLPIILEEGPEVESMAPIGEDIIGSKYPQSAEILPSGDELRRMAQKNRYAPENLTLRGILRCLGAMWLDHGGSVIVVVVLGVLACTLLY